MLLSATFGNFFIYVKSIQIFVRLLEMAIGKVSFILLTISVLLMSDLFWRISKKFFIFEYFVAYPHYVNKSKKMLVVGVMSAQNHFKERESIRNTWGQLIDQNLIDLKFLIGSKICPISPADRITPYECEKWSVGVPQSSHSTTINTINNSEMAYSGYTGFSFIVKHNISVLRLGMHRRIFDNNDCMRMRVLLIDAASGNKVTSATFLRANYTESGIFLWKAARTVKLSQGFEGELKLVSDKKINITCPSNIVKSGVIHIFEVQKEGVFRKFDEHSCLLVAFNYKLENKELLLNFIQEKETRRKIWEKEMQLLEYQLEIENRTYNDILFFDLIDVYKNLPLKLFEFLKWTQNVDGYKYILKTDDDVFIDIKTVVSVLMLYSDVDWDWWSCFRQKFSPPCFGKWRDRLYSEQFYPPFPSGAGYVITNSIASKIINENSVEDSTAGEDVALSVWVYKSLKRVPKILNTTCAFWACGIACSPIRPCNVPQLTWQQLHQTMHRLVSSHSICPN